MHIIRSKQYNVALNLLAWEKILYERVQICVNFSLRQEKCTYYVCTVREKIWYMDRRVDVWKEEMKAVV